MSTGEKLLAAAIFFFGVWVILALIEQGRVKKGPAEKIAIDALEDLGEYELESAF